MLLNFTRRTSIKFNELNSTEIRRLKQVLFEQFVTIHREIAHMQVS
jgi:hypothetical protein